MINHKFDNDFKPIKHPKNIKIVNTFQFEMLEKYIKFFKKLRNFFFCKLYVKMIIIIIVLLFSELCLATFGNIFNTNLQGFNLNTI